MNPLIGGYTSVWDAFVQCITFSHLFSKNMRFVHHCRRPTVVGQETTIVAMHIVESLVSRDADKHLPSVRNINIWRSQELITCV